MPDGELVFPGRNPDVGFLHCGAAGLSVNISTHTGFGRDVDVPALRACVVELGRRVPLLTARVRALRHVLPGPHHVWVAPPEPRRVPVPFETVELPAGADEQAVERHCARGANLPIDPSTDPPLRIELLRREDGVCDLVTTLHHALYDGASVGFIFYLLKHLYVAVRAGLEPGEVELPRVVTPADVNFVRDALGSAGLAKVGRVAAGGVRLLVRESRFRDVPVPGRDRAAGARSLHRTVVLDLDDPALDGLGPLLADRGATLNELLQAASARALFAQGRDDGWLRDTLPFATTFNLRRPSLEAYALGNLETATCLELRAADVDDPSRFLDVLVRRSASQKGSTLPLGHYLALKMLTLAPSSLMPGIVAKVANRAILLFSYLGSDFAGRYLGHFGRRVESEAVTALVRDWPGSGSGFVTSAPPMGMVVTVKRVGRRVAVNLSMHDRLMDTQALGRFAESLRREVEAYSAMGRPGKLIRVKRAAAAAPR